jgi:hypothetical protein
MVARDSTAAANDHENANSTRNLHATKLRATIRDGQSHRHAAEADREVADIRRTNEDTRVIVAELHVVPPLMKNLSIDFLVYFSINSKTLCRFCDMKNFSVSK